MTPQLIKTGANSWAVAVGRIEYQAGREFPWYAQHGGIGSQFATEREAVCFAATGLALTVKIDSTIC